MLIKRAILKSIDCCVRTSAAIHSMANPATRRSLFAAGFVFAASCAASSDTMIEASMENDFQLQVDQSAVVAAEHLELGFQAVTSDSRCGKGEVCIWEGDATVRVWVRRDGGAKEEHELHTGSRQPGAVAYTRYSIHLVALFPMPVTGRSISPTEYVATFRVTRGGYRADGLQ